MKVQSPYISRTIHNHLQVRESRHRASMSLMKHAEVRTESRRALKGTSLRAYISMWVGVSTLPPPGHCGHIRDRVETELFST